jgi:glycosyltransferase involved in cell wall biosynthesis
VELQGKILIIVENLPVPFDRRVWQEANALHNAGYAVSIICPKAMGYLVTHEVINDIHIYRHPVVIEADRALGYILEYSSALLWEFFFSWVVLFERGFDVIQACNPPDTIFLIGAFFKFFFGKKFVFDHHDINPELYLAKFQKKDFFYKLLVFLEFCTFKTADISIATNESFKAIALQRGRKNPEDVFVVRNGPDLKRMIIVSPEPELKMGRKYLVGYMGVMGKQDGIDYFLRTVQNIVYNHKNNDVHFTLIGGGTELAPMQDYAVKLDVHNYVTFAGWVSDEIMLKTLNTADVCVVPDEVNEMNDKSTLAKTMDYMALAKPVVQFELTEGRVTAQEASLYAKANDEEDMARKIIDLLNDEKLRKEMGAFGRNRVIQELSWDHQIPKLLAAYAKLLRKEV